MRCILYDTYALHVGRTATLQRIEDITPSGLLQKRVLAQSMCTSATDVLRTTKLAKRYHITKLHLWERPQHTHQLDNKEHTQVENNA